MQELVVGRFNSSSTKHFEVGSRACSKLAAIWAGMEPGATKDSEGRCTDSFMCKGVLQ